VDSVKAARWGSRLVGLILIILLLSVLRLIRAQFESLVGHEKPGAKPSAPSTQPTDPKKREGDVPADAIW